MEKKDFYYNLPESLIAQTPLKDRASSKLLVLNKEKGQVEDRSFRDLLNYIEAGDTIVLNDTRVIPARIFGAREGKEELIEFLLLKNLEDDIWEALVRPGKKVKIGNTIIFGQGILKAEVLSITKEGTRILEFSYKGIFNEILDRLGEMPLPPYIKEALEDKERYQTIYSRYPGSAAAPTAGLHFTEEFLEEIRKKGINIAFLTLHVGLGTFRPVKVEKVQEHIMHSEYYSLSKENAQLINETKAKGRKIISVGTTATRVLETLANEEGLVSEGKGWTDIFIYPGYRFKIVDRLITNFHLPESTLIMLVSAFSTRDYIIKAYEYAISNDYRFFSFGDAMIII